jgi:rod shape determining protein RodA
VFGKEIKGQANWYSFGSFSVQPAEFAKFATALALSKYLGNTQVNLSFPKYQFQALGIIFLPILLIIPHDPGSALIFSSLILVLYREGLPAWFLWTGFIVILLFISSLLFEPLYIVLVALIVITFLFFRARPIHRNVVMSSIVFVLISAFTFSVSYVFDNVFQQHHRDRFNILLGKEVDMRGIGYNINQSKIAVGSGGWTGKGFLEGTQTKGGFVPEQHTDYIFTTVGEEWGFVGSSVVIFLFITLILRILYLAERQKTKFSRVYGYCVASLLFIHFFINTAMVLGLFPTVGVPLPLFSYGGSGLLAFTTLIFIFVKMDANKVNEW